MGIDHQVVESRQVLGYGGELPCYLNQIIDVRSGAGISGQHPASVR